MRIIMRMMLTTLSIAALCAGSASAGNVTIPNDFQAGTPAVADDVDENFEAVRVEVNDNNTRISTNASNISTNTSNISNNTANINANATDIQNKGLIDVTVLTARCAGNVSFPNGSYVKLSDIGTFTKVLSGSIIEVQFNGTVYASIMNGNGAVFEIRVDDQPTASGWARIALKEGTMGNETTGTMTAIFSNLSTGSHTVGVWVFGANGSGSGAYIDPGCWDSTHVIVKELN